MMSSVAMVGGSSVWSRARADKFMMYEEEEIELCIAS